MEAAAAKISNPSLASTLRMQAQTLRDLHQEMEAASALVLASRSRMETATMRIEADAYGRRGNYAKAFPFYKELAEGGDSESIIALGYCYYNGWGVEKDYVAEDKWFEKAAAAGETSIMAHLGGVRVWRGRTKKRCSSC